MILAVLLIIAVAILTGITTFSNGGDSPRWAAISTIWLVIPVMVFGLLVLAIIIGLIYLMARGLKVIPPYTAQAQYYVNRGTDVAKQVSEKAAQPVVFLQGIAASLKAFFGRK